MCNYMMGIMCNGFDKPAIVAAKSLGNASATGNLHLRPLETVCLSLNCNYVGLELTPKYLPSISICPSKFYHVMAEASCQQRSHGQLLDLAQE